MSDTQVLPLVEAPGAHEVPPRRMLVGVALVSFSMLLLELACTRLFSVVLFYHFAFLAIGVALLGLGAGGVFAFLGRRWLAQWETSALVARVCVLNVVATVLALAIILIVPVSPELTWRNFGKLSAVYLATSVPFFLCGLVLSLVFAREAKKVSHLYGADLMGGALACLLVVPALNTIGAPNAILASALAMAACSAVWAPKRAQRNTALRMAVVMLALIAVNFRGDVFDRKYVRAVNREQPKIEFSRWNAISRVEVQEVGQAKYAVIDADAQTAIMNIDPRIAQQPEMRRRIFSGVPAVVNVLRPQGDYAIIGPGGGVDVIRALAGGSRNITGIEINPVIVNTIMLDKYRDYSQRLYEQPEVHIHVSDGRSFLRSSPELYDVVQMTLVDTWAATSAGVFALSENNLYTVEAFREYFEHLKPDGMLAVTRWEFRQPREALRVVSQGMAALRTLGVQRADAHFLIVANSPLDEDGVPVTVLIKRSPFTAGEEAALHAHLREHTHLRVLYTPSTQESNPFTRLIQSGDPWGFAQDYPYNVAPVTDDNPFFFFTVKAEDVIAGAIGGEARGIDWRINLGVAVLVMLLGISLGAVALFLILPLAVRTGVRGHNMLRLFYFVAVGLGYILVEIALIQRFVLFLGHPTYALTVVVFLMLLASGVGSVTARRWLAQPVRVRMVLAGIVLVVAAYVYLLPPLLARLVGLPFVAKLLLCGVLLLPLGFIMGMPFPTGLRALAGGGEETIEWAFALNAAASVLGSTLAVVIAIQWGLGATLATGAAAYALAATATSLWRRAEG
ncbi:MAG TPA: hypothetical protein VLE48_10885 [Terriglobales bacterium]|nr:hypothetical protein [Terriglobales bacterium]